ncbi:transglutaminase domain-containing protein [Phaeodactylibacter xiamenensis]|uniref:transglutaminase domain-containing protein n=1 Tax=Phaeodactylibacter xiamenensis TaxID=1524460 RepID=UPI003CCC1FA8
MYILNLRRILVIILLSIVFLVSVKSQSEYSEIYNYVNSIDIKSNNVSVVASYFANKFRKEDERVAAIYYWVANNISYDCKEYHNNKTKVFRGRTEEIINNRIEKWDEKSVRRTIKKQVGICEDYANLFNAICQASGIKSRKINGFAKTNYIQVGRSKFRTNHSWNIVTVDSKDYLIDVTWGSGFTDQKVTKFTRSYNDFYLFTEPEIFINTHYPLNMEDQLLQKPISAIEFGNLPLTTSSCSLEQSKLLPKNNELQVDELNNEIIISIVLDGNELSNTFRVGDRLGLIDSQNVYVDGNLVIRIKEDAIKGKELKIFVSNDKNLKYTQIASYNINHIN